MGVCRNLVGIAERVTFEDPIVLRRPRVWTPTVERLRPPIDPLGPAVDRHREVRLTAQLVGSLLAHAEHLSNLNDPKELPSCHSPQYP